MDYTIQPNDLFIAVMGVTGTGKSTLIARNTKEKYQGTNDELTSCNSRVSIHTAELQERRVHFVDTPGFDDSAKSDSEILEELAYWLIAAWESEIKLSGIIYLHRVTDTRLHGSALRSLNAFKAMCGEDAFPNIIVATTMWDTLSSSEVPSAVKRHEEFRQKACQDLIAGGGKLVALSAVEVDSVKIVQHLVQRHRKFTLALQQELMVEEKLLHETGAGRILFGASSRYVETLAKLTAKHFETKADLADDADRKSEVEWTHAIENLQTRRQLLEEGMQQATIATKDIKRIWEEKLRADDTSLQNEIGDCESCLGHKKEEVPEEHASDGKAYSITPDPTTNNSSSTKVAFLRPGHETSGMSDEFHELLMRRERLDAMYSHRLNQRRIAVRHPSPRVGIIGTGLALGQLVATLACVMM